MLSPFPGVDPYLESQGHWPDFHAQFIADCRIALNASLPQRYVARIDEQIWLVESSARPARQIRPDVVIVESGPPTGEAAASMATVEIEPVTIPLGMATVEELRQTRIEILALPEQSLVTVIELLSPSNKREPGWSDYLAKRAALIRQPVHIVELDLLLGGHRLPMGEALPPADYFAFVARSIRRPDCDVYAWSLRQALPTIPVPLRAPDPDVPLNLASLYAAVYEQGRYASLIDYQATLDLPLAPADRSWAEALSSQAG